MFGYNYHYTTNPAKGTIKLSPTAGTYAKAFAPALVIWGLLASLFVIANVSEKRQTTENEDPSED